ncbi:hypothetical protein RHGRI_013812 [Rhododendron griersonianum]|uniref:Uncharacterized protein n=1 Tax=Rhododendron griersonianum TaxID=479676 RepID=A0AAV6K705_9ERIC|nr:hypothetical protein RHGRI_013812 [Rhododendron griersonianum]
MANEAPSSSSVPPVGEDREDFVHGSESGWVEARTSCDHLAAALSSDLTHIPAPDTHCSRYVIFSLVL